jgi:ribosomal protein S18 acetylase RimI-like enzyme
VGDPFSVRTYRPSDEPDVVALWQRVFPDDPPRNEPRRDARRAHAGQPELFLVAESEGRVVATCMGGFDGHRGWVHRLAVDPARRRQGIAAALMARLEHSLEARGCPKLNLQVRAGNEGVVAFYQRLGYALEDRISLGKILPPSKEDAS